VSIIISISISIPPFKEILLLFFRFNRYITKITIKICFIKITRDTTAEEELDIQQQRPKNPIQSQNGL
jgi:hypothetical protein